MDDYDERPCDMVMASVFKTPLLEYHWPHTSSKIADNNTSSDTTPAPTYEWEPAGPTVNDYSDPIDVCYGSEILKEEPPRYNYNIDSMFNWDDKVTHSPNKRYWEPNNSKIRSDHSEDDFHGWYEAIEPDLTQVCWLLKAGLPIPQEYKHIRIDILKPFMDIHEDPDEDVENMMSLYYDAMADMDDANRHPDITQAIDLIKSNMPLPPNLDHINEGVLRAAMEYYGSTEIVLISRDGLEPTFEDVDAPSVADIIFKYKHKLKRFEKAEQKRAVVEAFLHVYDLRPLPLALQHVRADLLEQLMDEDLMAEMGQAHISSNTDLDHPDTHKWINDTYRDLLTLDRRCDSLIETLQKNYDEYVYTGEFPRVRVTDHDLLCQLAVMVQTHPNLNKQEVITDKAFITASIRSLSTYPLLL